MGEYKYKDYVNMRINTCICKMLYWKLGTQKANRFIKEKERKAKHYSFGEAFSLDGEEIDDSKVNRIVEGGRKSHYTKEEAVSVARIFNIDERYFLIKNDITITVPGITEDDWKLYLNVRYNAVGVYAIPVNKTQKREREIEEIVIGAIEDILKNSKWKNLSTDEPLYRILHYYTVGETFVGDDEITIVRKKLNVFESLGYEDFIKMDMEEITEHIVQIEKKLELMKAITVVEAHKS